MNINNDKLIISIPPLQKQRNEALNIKVGRKYTTFSRIHKKWKSDFNIARNGEQRC